MNVNHKIFFLAAVTASWSFSACNKDNGKDVTTPPVINSEEQITTVILTGHNHNDHHDPEHQFTVVWEDLDGTGGNAPHMDSLLLDTGIEYHTYVLLLDKTRTPWDTISKEVFEERDVHQFFYTPSASLAGKMGIEILDYDGNTPPLPVGLEFHMNIKSDALYPVPLYGDLNVVLSHYDGIPKTTARSPESDIDITFPVKLHKK